MFGFFKRQAGPPVPAPRSGTPRAVLADAVNERGIYVFKKVRRLTATYQIRLLAYMCCKESKQLVLIVPADCVFDDALESLMRLCP